MRICLSTSLLAALLLLCCGCSGYYYDKALEGMVGSPVEGVLAGHPPTNKYPTATGWAYIWAHEYEAQEGGYFRYVPRNRMVYDGYRGQYIARPEYVMDYIPPYTIIRWCKTIIYVNQQGRIIDYEFGGNDCTAEFWK